MRSRWFRRLAPLAFLLLVLTPRAASAASTPRPAAQASAVAHSHDAVVVAAHPQRSHSIVPRLDSSTPAALLTVPVLFGIIAGPVAPRRLASPHLARRERAPPQHS